MTPADLPADTSAARPTPPPPLVVAASVAAVEGVLAVALALLEVFSTDRDRLTMGLTTALFFAAYGVFLVVCAWLVTHGQAWARGPVLLAQLIQLGIAWNLRSGGTWPAGVALALVALVVIAGMVHPATMAALAGEERGPDA